MWDESHSTSEVVLGGEEQRRCIFILGLHRIEEEHRVMEIIPRVQKDAN